MFRVASRIGCTVAELGDRITQRELMEWCEYEAYELERTNKLDVYLARITAMLAAANNPKGSYSVTEFLLGEDKQKTDLRDMSEDQIAAMFKASIPCAEWKEWNKVI